MGAWIETHNAQRLLRSIDVAPLVGAWIETGDALSADDVPAVAPLMGARLETLYKVELYT